MQKFDDRLGAFNLADQDIVLENPVAAAGRLDGDRDIL
jgi:hypothetical protein